VTSVFAHRGLHLIERENTVAAYGAAVAIGVDGVELDVRRTRDGALVVHHDPRVDSFLIHDSDRSALPDYVPTLSEALESLGGVTVNVEIKNGRGIDEEYDDSGDLARQVLDVIEASGRSDRIIVSCFDLTTCTYVRSMNRDIAVAWLLWDVTVGDVLVQAHVLGLNAVNPHFSTVNAAHVARARELQLDLNVWTVNEAEDLERMVALEVASVITDDPALAKAVVGRSSPTSTDR
jgi:glycerophosphoryl diester phosphodiesterase